MPDSVPSLAGFRLARKGDARALAQLIEIAGEGIPRFLWALEAGPQGDPLDIGTARAAREGANFSYRNAVVAHREGEVAGMVLAYRLPQPTAEDVAALADLPALLRPLVDLEHQVPDSFYINALAVFPPYQGGGIGSALLAIAEERARRAACDTVSLQVFAENERACRLYRRHGFAIADRRPVVAHDCYPYSTDVLLMMRALSG